MKRPEFPTLLGGATAATGMRAPSVRAQSSPVVSFLNSSTPEPHQVNVAAFRRSLQEQGYVDGKNVAIDE